MSICSNVGEYATDTVSTWGSAITDPGLYMVALVLIPLIFAAGAVIFLLYGFSGKNGPLMAALKSYKPLKIFVTGFCFTLVGATYSMLVTINQRDTCNLSNQDLAYWALLTALWHFLVMLGAWLTVKSLLRRATS